jgi:hypothetical protein
LINANIGFADLFQPHFSKIIDNDQPDLRQ